MEALSTIKEGGFYVNYHRLTNASQIIDESLILQNNLTIISVGKLQIVSVVVYEYKMLFFFFHQRQTKLSSNSMALREMAVRLWFPQFELSIFTISGQQILFRVVCNADGHLFAQLEHMLHLAGNHAEAIQIMILTSRKDEVAPGRWYARHKVSTISHSIGECFDNLWI